MQGRAKASPQKQRRCSLSRALRLLILLGFVGLFLFSSAKFNLILAGFRSTVAEIPLVPAMLVVLAVNTLRTLVPPIHYAFPFAAMLQVLVVSPAAFTHQAHTRTVLH